MAQGCGEVSRSYASQAASCRAFALVARVGLTAKVGNDQQGLPLPFTAIDHNTGLFGSRSW